MKLLVIGGTGGTGQKVIEQALDQGHHVTALARRPEAFPLRHERLTVLRGDVLDRPSLDAAVRGRDAVLSALGVVRFADMFKYVTLYSEGGRNLSAAMEHAGVRRLIAVTSGGVEHDDPSFGFFYKRILRPVMIQRAYDDMVRFEQDLHATSLDWTIVRPTLLTNGPRTDKYRVSGRFAPPNGAKISRADLAAFMLLELEAKEHVHATPTLAY